MDRRRTILERSFSYLASFPANLGALHSSLPSGTTVTVPAGNNGNQTLTLDKPMRFVGAPGAILGDVMFSNGSGHVELRNMEVGTVTMGPWDSGGAGATPPAQTNNIRLTNLVGKRWLIHYARAITIVGGDWSPGVGGQRAGSIHGIEPYDAYNVSSDILVEGGLYHDVWTVQGGDHSEGIVIWGGNGITLRGVSFLRCGGTGDIGLFFPEWTQYETYENYSILANIRIENCQGSSFWTTPFNGYYDAYYNVQVSDNPSIPSLSFSNNTWPKTTHGDHSGILRFDRAVPGGTPKTATPPAGWGR